MHSFALKICFLKMRLILIAFWKKSKLNEMKKWGLSMAQNKEHPVRRRFCRSLCTSGDILAPFNIWCGVGFRRYKVQTWIYKMQGAFLLQFWTLQLFKFIYFVLKYSLLILTLIIKKYITLGNMISCKFYIELNSKCMGRK